LEEIRDQIFRRARERFGGVLFHRVIQAKSPRGSQASNGFQTKRLAVTIG
jgi:hypothetical protein